MALGYRALTRLVSEAVTHFGGIDILVYNVSSISGLCGNVAINADALSQAGLAQRTRYLLRVEWKRVDHHVVTFGASEAFQKWRALAGPFFAEPPVIMHSARDYRLLITRGERSRLVRNPRPARSTGAIVTSR